MKRALASVIAFLPTALVPIVAVAVLVAPSARADQIWYQSVGRSSASNVCQVSTIADLATGWTPWVGSWEQWMNAGSGGYTCTRSLRWARNSVDPVPIAGAGCVLADTGAPHTYAYFDSQNFLPVLGSSFTDAACTSVLGGYIFPLAYGVTFSAADAICIARVPGTNAAAQPWTGPNVYACV